MKISPIWRAVAVGEGLDVDDHLFAHRDPPLDRRRAHVRKQNNIIESPQPQVDSWLVLEDVEARAPDGTDFEQPDQFLFVDDLATRRVDEDRVRLQEPQPPRGKQVKSCRCVRTIDRDDVHVGEHLVETLPIGRLERALDVLRHRAPVVIVDR